jgi:hypothetical protein
MSQQLEATDLGSTLKWSNFCSACYLLCAGFSLGVFFDPEDGGDMFFRNDFQRKTRRYILEDRTPYYTRD